MTKGARAGFTLVEVLLAGVICAFMTLALMEGLIVSAKISHENAERLAADAFAWDTAWRWLNKSYDELPSVAEGTIYDSSRDTALTIASDECPALARDKTGGDPRLVVKVSKCAAGTLRRHGLDVEAKRIDVDVEWGPANDRKCLNDLRGVGTRQYGQPVTLYKSSIERGTL